MTTSLEKELLRQAAKQAREQELRYLRQPGVYEKVDAHATVAKRGCVFFGCVFVFFTYIDKAFQTGPMQIRSRIVAREFRKSEDRPDLYAGTRPLEALKATISIAANHKATFSIMHIGVTRAYFHAKAQRLVLIRLPV